MSNYRPISVISVFSKIVESVIKNRMMSFISKYVPLDEYQYGFIEHSNTQSAVIDLVNKVSGDLDGGKI